MDYGLWIMDYGLWIMDYGLWIGNRFMRLGYVHPFVTIIFLSRYKFYIVVRLAYDNLPV